jgi:hypothetical protein
MYLGYVAANCVPQTLYEFSRCLYWKTGIQEFIATVDAQSADLLSIEQDQALLLNKGSYINLNGLMAKILKQPEINNRILLKNGHLSTIPGDNSDSQNPQKVRQAADNVIRLHDRHSANGGNFLFVMVPTQVSKYEDLLPTGYRDTVNGPADVFLSYLEEAGVPYLDLREALQEDGISITNAYYTTDHHWTPETGFWAYGRILEKLEQMGAIAPVDPFYTDAGNYTFETYEDSFLGSSGKRVGIYYAGLDDSTFIYPNFETDISVSIPNRQVELQGAFQDVAYHQQLDYKFEGTDFFNTNFHSFFGWSDNPITHWRNPHAPEQSKFLLIGESFGNIPFSLMSIALGVNDEMDMRHFEGNFSDYYQEYQPDTVILEVNAGAIISEFTFSDYLE